MEHMKNWYTSDSSRTRTESECEKIIAHDSKVDLDNVPVPKDLKELVSIIRKVFSNDIVNVDYVKTLLENYKSNPKDWRHYAKYDPHKYTRNLVDDGNGKYNILLLCWAESQGSSIHDHSNSHCFMKCLDGEFVETKYEWPEKSENDENSEGAEMKEIARTCVKVNQVCYINDSIGLHRVENLSHTKPTVTLHIYIPPYNECKSFDQQTGRDRKVEITFYSKFGEKV